MWVREVLKAAGYIGRIFSLILFNDTVATMNDTEITMNDERLNKYAPPTQYTKQPLAV